MGNVCNRWLGCCFCSPSNQDQPDVTFQKSSKRSCTDVLFLLLYICSWVGFVAICIVAYKRGGNPNKILHGMNYMNQTCGSGAQSDNPYLAWLALPQNATGLAQCNGCATIFTCLANCSATQKDTTMINNYESQRVLYYCIPKLTADITSFPFEDQVQSVTNQASFAVADLYVTWPVILGSAGIALLIALVYLLFSIKFSGVLIFLAIAAVAIGGAFISWILFQKASEADDTQLTTRAKGLRAAGYIFAIATGLFILLVIALRKRIYIAIEVIKEASRCVLSIPSMIFFPIFPFIVGVGYFALFVLTALLIFSVFNTSEEPMPQYIQTARGIPTYSDYTWDRSLKYSFAFVFFHLLWTLQFLIYFSFMCLAGAIAQWYFAPRDPKSGNKETPSFILLRSIYRSIRFHLGTVLLGALIIAIIQFIRCVLKYIEEKTSSAHPNYLQRAIFCCIQCCLWCVQVFMDKINKNAFVWTAIWGDPFCQASFGAFALLWSNLIRVAAVNFVSTFLIFLGKVLVATLTTGIGALIIFRVYRDELYSAILPIIVILLLSYLVAAIVMNTLDTCVDTVFLCFLVDEKYNKASGKMSGHEGLIKVIDAHREQNEKEGKKQVELASRRSPKNQNMEVK